MNDQDEMFEAATETPAFLGCPQHMPTKLPGGFDGTEPGEKKHKFGLLRNGVQMIRFAQGDNVELIGKRERGPNERQFGRTEKIIYRAKINRKTKSATIDMDGVRHFTVFCPSLKRMEYAAFFLFNASIAFNAMCNRHKKARLARRKAEATAKLIKEELA